MYVITALIHLLVILSYLIIKFTHWYKLVLLKQWFIKLFYATFAKMWQQSLGVICSLTGGTELAFEIKKKSVFLFQKKKSSLHTQSSLSIRRFWGKGERWKRKRERASPPPPSKISSPLALQEGLILRLHTVCLTHFCLHVQTYYFFTVLILSL